MLHPNAGVAREVNVSAWSVPYSSSRKDTSLFQGDVAHVAPAWSWRSGLACVSAWSQSRGISTQGQLFGYTFLLLLGNGARVAHRVRMEEEPHCLSDVLCQWWLVLPPFEGGTQVVKWWMTSWDTWEWGKRCAHYPVQMFIFWYLHTTLENNIYTWLVWCNTSRRFHCQCLQDLLMVLVTFQFLRNNAELWEMSSLD